MRHLFFLLFIGLIYSCCTKENPNASGTDSITGLDYSIEKPYLKQVEPTQDGRHCRMENPMIDGDRIIYFIKDDETGEGWINCYDKYSLELLWTWNDAHTEYGAKGFGNYSYIYDDVLCISQSNLSYGIDINTGLTLWHQKAESGRSYIFGLDDEIFKNTNEVFNADATLRKASYQDGEWEGIFSIVQDDSLSVQMLMPCLFEWEGNNYAAVVTAKWLPSPVIRQYWLNLYSLTEDRLVWTSDTIPLHSNLSGIPGGLPVFTDGQILLGKAESGQSTLTGIGDKIFKNTHEVFNADANLRVASTEDGVWSELYSVYQDDSMSVQMKTATLFEWQGKEYATFITSKWQPFPSIEHTWLNLYSLTEDRVVWQSDTIPLHHVLSGTPGRHPVFCDGQILIGNGGVYSYNIEDGSLEWWKHYGNTFVGLGSYLHAQDGIVYGNNEDGYLAAWDVHTGDEIFNVESGGLCSQIQICDNKLYQTSYSKNVFFVYDSSTGEKLYEVNAPYYERFTENDRLFFENVMVVDPETCLAYTTDKMHLLVYEFE